MSVEDRGVGCPSSASTIPQNAAQIMLINSPPEGDFAIPPTATEFARKLYRLLEDPLTDSSVVCWAPTKDRFIIKDTAVFAKTVLPRVFHHSNFSSFVRQLNKYDFHKVKTRSIDFHQTWTFEHHHFHQDKPQDLHLIQRKTTTQALASLPDNGTSREETPSFEDLEEPDNVLTDSELKSHVNRLRAENEQLRTRITELEKTNGAMSFNLQSIESKVFLQSEKMAIARQIFAERGGLTGPSISQPNFQPAEPLQYDQNSQSPIQLAPSQSPLIIEDQRWSQQVGDLGQPITSSTASLASSSVHFEGPGRELGHYLQAEQWNEARDSNGQWEGQGVIPQIGIAGSTPPGRGEFFRDQIGLPMHKRRRVSGSIVIPYAGAEQKCEEFGLDSENHAGTGLSDIERRD